MARHEQDLQADAAMPLSVEDLLRLIGGDGELGPRARQDAIACYLSAADGWREAVRQLGGAFAEGEAGLRERKAE